MQDVEEATGIGETNLSVAMFEAFQENFNMCFTAREGSFGPIYRAGYTQRELANVDRCPPPVNEPFQAFRFSATWGIST